MADYDFAPTPLPPEVAAQLQQRQQQQFLTPQAAMQLGPDVGMQQEAIQRRLAMAQALRGGIGKQRHITGLGAALGGIGDIINASSARQLQEQAQGEQQGLMSQEQMERQAMLEALKDPAKRQQALDAAALSGNPSLTKVAEQELQRDMLRQKAQELAEYRNNRLGAPQKFQGKDGAWYVFHPDTNQVEPLTGPAVVPDVAVDPFTGQHYDKHKAPGAGGGLPAAGGAPAGGGHGSTGVMGLGDDQLNVLADQYAVSGEFPKGMGRGPQVMALNKAILARALQRHPDLNPAMAHAVYGSQMHELGQATTQQGQQAVLEAKAAKDVDLLRQEMHGVPDYNSTWANQALRDVMKQRQNPQMGRYATQLYTTAQGVAKAIAASNNATEGQRHEADELLSANDSLENTAAKLEVLMRDIENSGRATRQRVENARNAISGRQQPQQQSSQPEPVQAAAAPEAPERVQVTFQGRTLTIPRARLAEALKDGAQEVK